MCVRTILGHPRKPLDDAGQEKDDDKYDEDGGYDEDSGYGEELDEDWGITSVLLSVPLLNSLAPPMSTSMDEHTLVSYIAWEGTTRRITVSLQAC